MLGVSDWGQFLGEVLAGSAWGNVGGSVAVSAWRAIVDDPDGHRVELTEFNRAAKAERYGCHHRNGGDF